MLRARKAAKAGRASVPQVVPRVIWQTWKDTSPGPRRFEGMSSMALVNPEYDYVLFTDEDCRRFMCELADPDTRLAYEVCAHDLQCKMICLRLGPSLTMHLITLCGTSCTVLGCPCAHAARASLHRYRAILIAISSSCSAGLVFISQSGPCGTMRCHEHACSLEAKSDSMSTVMLRI